MTLKSGNTFWRGRHSTVDLFTKLDCFTQKAKKVMQVVVPIMLAQGVHLYWVVPSVSISYLSDTGIVLASGGCTIVEPPLFHPADGFANPKYKLLHFFTTIIFFKEKKALAFNWDRCCNLALCLWLILFHWLRVIRLRVWFQMPLSLGEIKGRGGQGGAGRGREY